MGKNLDHKGRRSEPRHIRLYHSVTGCDSWRDLSGNAVKVLIVLARFENGGVGPAPVVNGEVYLSARNAASLAGMSLNTANRALRELDAHGFIKPVEVGHFRVKDGPATSWRMTWMAAPKRCGPTRDFERWDGNGNKSRSQILNEPVSNFATALRNNPAAVSNIATAAQETPLVSVATALSNIETQAVCHVEATSDPDSSPRKHAEYTNGVSNDLIGGLLPDEIRRQAITYLEAAGVGAQSQLAHVAGIPGGTLSKFIAGRGLARHHLDSLARHLGERDAA